MLFFIVQACWLAGQLICLVIMALASNQGLSEVVLRAQVLWGTCLIAQMAGRIEHKIDLLSKD